MEKWFSPEKVQISSFAKDAFAFSIVGKGVSRFSIAKGDQDRKGKKSSSLSYLEARRLLEPLL